MGLDPATQATLSPMLFRLAQASSPRLLLALRPQDPLPDWITHLIYLSPNLRICSQGSKDDVLKDLQGRALKPYPPATLARPVEIDGKLSDNGIFLAETAAVSPDGVTDDKSSLNDLNLPKIGEPVVQMEDVVIKYGEKQVLGGWTEDYEGKIRAGLRWNVRRGERWGLFGANGMHEVILSRNNP